MKPAEFFGIKRNLMSYFKLQLLEHDDFISKTSIEKVILLEKLKELIKYIAKLILT